MRLLGRRSTTGLRAATVAGLSVALAVSGRAGTLDDRALARVLAQATEDALRGRPVDGDALAAQVARLARADAAHRARFARAMTVAGTGESAGRAERARAAYEAGQGRLLVLLREAQTAQGDAAAALLEEAHELHARIEAASAPPPASAGPRLRAPRITAPPLPAASRHADEPQGLEPPIGSVPAPLQQAAAALAGPIDVYEWVRNTIRPEFYHGRMKGPLETFHERSGNDVDTAGVLVEMLRAKGVPARYVRAVVEMPATVLVAVTGTADVTQALRVLARAGIPHEPIAGSAGPIAVRLHRVLVEALVPYANYRGAVIDNQGSVWLRLDPSFKAMAPPVGRDVMPLGFDPRQSFDAYLAGAQAATPLEYLRTRVVELLATQLPGTTYAQVLNRRTFEAERLGLLPSTLPYRVVSVAGVGYEVDEDLRQRLRVVGEDADGVFLDATVDTADLLGRRLTIGYRPETEDDRRIVEAYGGLHLTPPYLIAVVPVLKIGGVPVATASRGVGMAVRYELRISLLTPGGSEDVVNRVQAGNLLALGLAGRQPSDPDQEATAADQILSRIAIDYFARWNASDDELADLLRVVPVRPVPSVCLAQSDVEVEYAGGDPLFPLTFDWKGILVDADLRPAAPVGVETSAAESRFLLLSGLEGSVQEDRVFAQGLEIAAVSTAQVLGLAASAGTPVHDLTRENVDVVLPTLPFDAHVKAEIRDAALSGLLVRVPAAPVTRLAWTGVGYVLLDEETGEAAWQIQGGHSGGVTAPAVVDIPDEISDPLIEQGETIEPAPEDAQVRSIERFVSTDLQEGYVDKLLPGALRVLVTDEEGRAVRNANVTFTVIGGGGALLDPILSGAQAPEVTVRSNERGEAEVVLRLGKRTDEIPRLLIHEGTELEPTLVGLNLVTARAGLVALPEPFTAIAFPDTQFDGTFQYADFRWSGAYVRPDPNGSVAARLRLVAEDPHGNPISNFPLTYKYRSPAIEVAPPAGYVRMRSANDSPSWLLSAESYRACIEVHPVPLTGQCAGEVATLPVLTSWLGADAYVAVGDSPLSHYFFDVATDTGSAVGFYAVPTTGWVCPIAHGGLCTSGAPAPPIIASGLRLFRANALGNVIEAYPLLGTARMEFWADAISEIERVEPVDDSDGVTHYMVHGTNKWRRERLSDSKITLEPSTTGTVPDPVAGPLGDGRYAASIRMGGLPQENRVRYEGEHYPLELMRKDDRWDELDPDYVDPITLAVTRVRAPWGPWHRSSGFGLWGIDVRLSDLQPTPVRVGAQGSVTEASTIRAHVDPPAYRALLAPTDVLFQIVRDGEAVMAANGTSGQFSVPVGLPFPSEPHQGVLSVLGVSATAHGNSPDVVSEPVDLPGCSLLDLKTPVVNIELTTDRLNGTVCADDKPLMFHVCRAANVTLRVDGQVFEGYVDNGEAPVRIDDLPLAPGAHTVKVPPGALAADFIADPTPQRPFVLRAVDTDDPQVVQEAPGVIMARTLNRSVLPVGHTIVKGVDLADGHLTTSYADVELAGRHLGLTVRRTYSSAGASREGLLGAGWAFSYESQLRVNSCGAAVVQTADGSNQVFKGATDGVSYTPQKGYHGRLVRNADASFDYFDKAGVRHHFQEPDSGASIEGTRRLRYIEEPHGDRIVLTYDANQRLARVAEVHPDGGEVRWLEFQYVKKGGFDRIAKVTSSLGHTAAYSYDNWGNLTRAERLAADATWSERYDYTASNPKDRHQMVALQSANGNRVTYAYYAESDALPGWDLRFGLDKTEYTRRVTEYPGNGGGVVTEFLYDLSEALEARWKTSVRDPRGHETRYVMNGYGAVFEMHEPLGRSTFFEWAPDDVLKKSEKDANGRLTRYAHDARGNLTAETVTSADGSTTVPVATFAYDPRFNRMTLRSDGVGHKTTYQIDPLDGDVLSMTDPVNALTSYDYDQQGRLLRETDHDGQVTVHSDHDSFGHARTVTRPLGLVVARTYDARGRLIEERDSFGHEAVTAYDGFDRPTSVRRRALDPQSADELTTTAYFPAGQVRRTTTATAAVTEVTLDGMDRVVHSAVSGPGLPGPLESSFTYDGNGNRITDRDARGVARQTTFDALNQATQVEITAGPGGGPTGVIARSTYDLVGNKKTETDLAGLVTSFDHDLLYRVQRKTLPESGPAGAYFEEYEHDLAGNMTLRRDANGHTRSFTYDGHNRRVAWQDEAGHARRVSFDLASGRLDRPKEEADDTAGRRTHYEYDALHRETARRVRLEGPGGDGAEYLTTTEYPSGRVTVTTDPRLGEARVERDGLDRTVAVRVDPHGLDLTTRTVYDGLGKPTSVTDPRGKVARSTYDAIGRLLETTDANEKTTTYLYDGGGLKTQVTDRRGVRRDLTYDNLGRPRTESIVPSLSGVPWRRETRYEDVARRRLELDALDRATTYELDGLGRVVKETDADEKYRLFTYDGVNKRSETDKRPQHHLTSFTYDVFDRLLETAHPPLDGVPFTSTTVYQDAANTRVDTDRRGIATTTRMDPLGRTREVARGDALVERHTYDGNGNRLASLDAESRQTTFEYDAANRLVRRTDGFGTANESSITYTPDANGNVVEERDARAAELSQPFSVQRTYDALNRLETVTDGEQHTVENGWDPEGNKIRVHHPEGNELLFDYDELAKVTATTEPSTGEGPAVTEHEYDANRNRTEQKDARLNAVEMRYDVLGRLETMIQPEDLTTRRDYDANGSVLVLTDPKGQTVTSTYDEWNRVKTKVYAFAPGDTYRPWRWLSSVVYEYDANDNVTRVEETVASGTDPPPPASNQVTDRTYDDFDRLLSETVTLPDGGTKTVSYTYFKNGNRKTVTDPAGIVTHYTYDGQNRLETVTTPEGVTTYTHWPDGLLKTVTYPNGVVSSHGYDLADRLTSLETRRGAIVVSSYAYTYDANGNRLTQTETNGGLPETTTYTYDARDRLETVTYPSDEMSATGRLVTYTYDAVGNRLTELTVDPVSSDPIASKSGTFDALNRLTSLADLLDPAATITFDYDRNGNQTSKTIGAPGGAGATTSFRYDVRDRLVEVETPTVVAVRMGYDADGRLLKKIGEDGIRQYVYDEDSRFLEYDTAGLQVAKYSYGADRLISLLRADEGTRFYHLDGLGSVTALTDPSGIVASRLLLDAWGVFRNPNATDGLSASKNRFAFTGYVFDRETELYFAKARFYDPTVGRFTSQDSFLGDTDRPPSLHRYYYANANPARYIDPSGHFSIEELRQHLTSDLKAASRAGRSMIETAGRGADQGRLGFGGLFVANFAGHAAQVPEQIGTDLVDLLTPGTRSDGSPGGYFRRQQTPLLNMPGNPMDQLSAATEAWGLQPGVVVEEGYVEPLLQAPGQLLSAGQHAKLAVLAEDGVDRFAHAASAVRDGASAVGAVLNALAPFEGVRLPGPRSRTLRARARAAETARIEGALDVSGGTSTAMVRYDPAYLAEQMSEFGVSMYNSAVGAQVMAQETLTLGRPGGGAWLLPAKEVLKATSSADLVQLSGRARLVTDAALAGEPIYATVVPMKELKGVSLPKGTEAGANAHFTGTGYTGVFGDSFLMPNPAALEVHAPHQTVPPGGMMIRFDRGSGWVPVRGVKK